MSHDHRSIDRPAIDRGKLKSTRGEKNSVRDDGVDADCTSKFVLLDVNGVKKKKNQYGEAVPISAKINLTKFR